MSSPRCWPGFARSERRRRRCGRGGDGGVVDSGGDGWAGRIIAAFQGREREEALEDRISRFWRAREKIGMRSPGTCRYMPSCAFWGWVLSDLTKGISTGTCSGLNAPSGAGCFLTPASGNGVVSPLPEAGAPPAPQAPRGTGQPCLYLTTFRRRDAKRHRRHPEHLQPPTSNDVKPKGRRSHP